MFLICSQSVRLYTLKLTVTVYVDSGANVTLKVQFVNNSSAITIILYSCK